MIPFLRNHLVQTSTLPRGAFAFMLRYVRLHPVGHAVVLASVLGAVGSGVAAQYAIKFLVDVLSAGPGAPVWVAFGVLAALVAADNLTWRIGGWMASHTFVAVTGDLRRDLFQHLTGHAPCYFVDRSPGTLSGRITATANAVYTVESMISWNTLPPFIAVFASIAVLGSVDWHLALVLVVIALALGGIIMRMAQKGQTLHHAYATEAAAVDGELVDVISNMHLVRAFGATLREQQRFSDRVGRETDARGRSLRSLERLRLFHAVTTAILTTGLLAWGIMLWTQHRATTGDVVLITTLGFSILHASRDLAVALVDLVQHVARLSEALNTLLLPHEMVDMVDAQKLESVQGEVTFENVTFGYPGTAPVLRDFSLHVRPGERLGLVGRSGSGKSTVLALLQRLRDVGEGQISVDGLDIAAMTQDSLHQAISVVPQEVMLFHRSVLENIRYGRPDAAEEEVRAAAAAAGCDFIHALPEGFDTQVGDRGVKLSGGQRQRLSIARAFLRNAPILLLDEATSALDSESEEKVQRALERLMQGRTVIAVAHRLSTLQDFDRIVVMQSGRILQDGTPRLLEAVAGPYQDLLRRQVMNAPEGRRAEAA